MKKQYTNFMMQSASEFDQAKVKEAVQAKVKEEVPSSTSDTTSTNQLEDKTKRPEQNAAAVAPAKAAKSRLRQQAYYLTEEEIKTIKRLSYELDIPKSDLVRKFIDEGISNIDQK